MVKLGHVDNQILWSISGPCSFSMLLIIGESTFSKWLIRSIVNQYFEFKIGLHSNWPIEFKIILNFRAKGLQKKYSEAVIPENEKIKRKFFFEKFENFQKEVGMYIKNIELDGFKSYAKRTEIKDFDNLFNAITGLNGSGLSFFTVQFTLHATHFLGKSNILDSICFLLGIQQLSQVRASNLTELVYKVNYSHFYGTFYGLEFRMAKQVSSERPCQLRLTIATKVIW